jgi:hypothetical protein
MSTQLIATLAALMGLLLGTTLGFMVASMTRSAAMEMPARPEPAAPRFSAWDSVIVIGADDLPIQREDMALYCCQVVDTVWDKTANCWAYVVRTQEGLPGYQLEGDLFRWDDEESAFEMFEMSDNE